MPLCEIAIFLYTGHVVVGASKQCIKYLRENADRCQYTVSSLSLIYHRHIGSQVLNELAVSGAFHTGLMQPAQAAVDAAVRDVTLNAPRLNVYSNFSGKVFPRKPSQIRQQIVKQLNYPVKWEQIMQLIYRKHQVSIFHLNFSLCLSLQDYRFPTFYEIGPGRQLGAILFQVSKKAFKTYKSCGD